MAFDWLKKSKKKSAEDAAAAEAERHKDLQSQTPAELENTAAEPADVEAGAPTDRRRKASVDDGASVGTSGGLFKRLRHGLAKTRKILTTDIDDLFTRRKALDADLLEDLEEILITADIGVQTTMELTEKISSKAADIKTAADLKSVLKGEILALLRESTPQAAPPAGPPTVIMVVGVNGVGKTTTIGKLAARFGADGKKVLVAASDTFRAAAIEQLGIWADRAGAEFVKHRDGADPAAVAYDGIEAALARAVDVVLVDTAGRLHTKVNLMQELKKIIRTVQKRLPDAPHEILLVLDATTGQNALSQARMFNEALGISGIALTKLDGTAKGGIVVSIYRSLQIPLKYIGVGEKIEDLQIFDPEQFVDALF
jgi:fused signal recognition particle receptor